MVPSGRYTAEGNLLYKYTQGVLGLSRLRKEEREERVLSAHRIYWQ